MTDRTQHSGNQLAGGASERPRVSVLVAVYNTAAYLPQCLESLMAQTLHDFEVWCVDDGSTDGSWQVLEDFAARDSRIRLLRLKDNHGQAFARNQALRRAQGEYIAFLDSDDWFSDDALEKAVETFEQHPATDAVLFRLLLDYGLGDIRPYQMQPFEVLRGKDAFRLSLTWRVHGVYMVRAAIHKQYPYDEASKAYSDDNTTRIHYYISREVRPCEGIYYWRQHPASTTHQVSMRQFDVLIANRSMREAMLRLGVGHDLLSLYETHRWTNLVGVCLFACRHRRDFSAADVQRGLSMIRRAWLSIDTAALPRRLRWKFGYIPFRFCWPLFRLEERLYSFLRLHLRGY